MRVLRCVHEIEGGRADRAEPPGAWIWAATVQLQIWGAVRKPPEAIIIRALLGAVE
jgi:hypothetical protein